MNLAYKKQYFNDLNSKINMDTKKFWAKVTPLFSSKSTTANIIIPYENNRITKGKKNIVNKDFTHLTKTFRLKKDFSCSEEETCETYAQKLQKGRKIKSKGKRSEYLLIFSFPNKFYLFA